MNHKRCCANDKGICSGRCLCPMRGTSFLPLCPSCSIRPASPATVGVSKIARTGSSTPSTPPIRDISCVASSECPPNSKKFDSRPTPFTFSNCSHIPATISSTAVLAPSFSFSPSPSTCTAIPAKALRSSFPWIVSGNSGNSTSIHGTMYSGSRSCKYLFNSPISNSSAPSLFTTYPTNCFCPPSPALSTTAACFTPPCFTSIASISPGSIRFPLNFICSSARPRYSSTPSPLHLTTSPLRYTLSPSLPLHPSGTNFSAVQSPLPIYPRASPAPPIYNSPFTPTGASSPPPSTTYIRTLSIGRPIGTPPSLSSLPSFPSSPSSSPPHLQLLTSTAASVGPYKFSIRTPSFLPLLSANSSLNASPLHTINRKLPHPCSTPSSPTKTSSIDGTKCTIVIPRFSISSRKYLPSRCPPGRAITTPAPFNKGQKNSHTDTSKL